MTTKLKTMAECIEDGIRLLDERRPGWIEKIDLSKFSITSGCNCVIGQIDGDYSVGLIELEIAGPRDNDNDKIRKASPLGFTLPLEVGLDEFDILQKAWVRRLIQLKAERGIS